MTLPTIRAKTLVEAKAKIRAALGWSDRRSWTEAERLEASRKYSLVIDHKTSDFVATPKHD